MTPLAAAAVLVPALAGAAPASLADCFAAALKRSEAVAAQRELAVQAREHVAQAGGAVLPSVSGVASYLWEDTGGQATAIRSAIAPSTQPFAKITADQPLFRGLREFAALRQFRRLAEAQDAGVRQAEVQLYEDVAQAYYAVLSLEGDLANLSAETRACEERVATLRERERTGRSRTSEVLAAQSAQAGIDAQAAQVKGQLDAARDTLAFLTGLQPALPLADGEPAPGAPDALAAYLAGAGDRPEVRAARLRSAAAAAGVALARGAFWPSLDLVGNYYLKRTGALADVRWDAQLALTVPLFTGGATVSRLREAHSAARGADDALSAARRAAETDIRSAWDRVRGDAAQADALDRAADLAARNEAEQTREYKLGLTTNLDVLAALTTRQDTERARDRARWTLKADLIRLEAAAGRRPATRTDSGQALSSAEGPAPKGDPAP